MIEKIIQCSEELLLNSSETLFLCKVILSNRELADRDLPDHKKTLEKIRKTLKEKGYLTWKMNNMRTHIYNTSGLEAWLSLIEVKKPIDLMSYLEVL